MADPAFTFFGSRPDTPTPSRPRLEDRDECRARTANLSAVLDDPQVVFTARPVR
jgi:hypothetical protein